MKRRKYLVTVERPAGGEIDLAIEAGRALPQPEVRRILQAAGYRLTRFTAACRCLERRAVEQGDEIHIAAPPMSCPSSPP
jgi:hypothetical protein